MRSPEYVQKNIDLFAYIFLLSQRLQYISDKQLKGNGLTTKQFLMMAVTEKSFDHSPGIKEVAEALSTSHQNIKQMANQLEKKGFIEQFKDPNDMRVTRLRNTEYCKDFWDNHADEQMMDIMQMFKELTDQEIETMYVISKKLYQTLEPMYK